MPVAVPNRLPRVVAVLVAAFMLAAVALVGSAPPAVGTTPPPAIYLVPHQDDETLSMSADIRAHIDAGRPVELYLYTDGSHTRVCSNTRYGLNLDRAACTAARDAEYAQATLMLGIPASSTHVVVDPATGVRPNDYPTVDAARRMLDWVIDDVAARYPEVDPSRISWKAMSWADNHPGHAVMGQALREAWRSGDVTDVRFFLKRRANGSWPYRPDGTSKRINEVVPRGSASWYKVRAASFAYAIGNLSVPAEFRWVRSDVRSLVHDATREDQS